MNYSAGPEHLFTVSGKKTDSAVVQLASGEGENLGMRREMEFDLSVATGGEVAEQNQKEYLATMFDAQKVANGKLIKVSRESEQYKVSIVPTVGPEEALTNSRAKQYREEDRINRKYKIDKAVKIGKTVGKIVGGLAAGL